MFGFQVNKNASRPSQSFLAVALLFFLAFPALFTAATQSLGAAPAAPGYNADSEPVEKPPIGHFRRALARVQPYIKRYGYWAAAAAVLLEGLGIPTPGQTLLIAGAVEAVEGRMNLAVLFFLVTAAAVLGNSMGYVIGRWAGRPVLTRLKVNLQRQQRLEELFKRYGGLLVLLGRFVDGLRQLNGIVSGTMKMPWGVFTAYNVAGACLWTGAWVLGTYYLGKRIHYIAAFFHHHRALLYMIAAALVLTFLAYLFRRRSLS